MHEQHKISKEKRELIQNELKFLEGGKNLDLGCGSYSYLPSVGYDFSNKMLQFNDNCIKKVVGDLEGKLPFKDKEFDSVTAVFVLNYVKNYSHLLTETQRVLKSNGTFVIVLGNVNGWQKQKEVNCFSLDEWAKVIKKIGFAVETYNEEGLLFFKARK